MVRLKQPARRRTSCAQFLGLLPRPGLTKSHGQPGSSDNRAGPNSIHGIDTVCGICRGGSDVSKEQAVHSPFLPTSGAETGTHGCSTLPVDSGWATTLLASWHHHTQMPGGFAAHLVGDASNPDLYVSLASSDLASCRCETAADSNTAGLHAAIMPLLTQMQFAVSGVETGLNSTRTRHSHSS